MKIVPAISSSNTQSPEGIETSTNTVVQAALQAVTRCNTVIALGKSIFNTSREAKYINGRTMHYILISKSWRYTSSFASLIIIFLKYFNLFTTIFPRFIG